MSTHPFDRIKKDRSGGVLVMTALMITVLLSMGALAVDAPYLLNVRSKLQHTADSIALASASGLIEDEATARLRADEYAQRNPVLGEPLILGGDQQVEYGSWDYEDRDFVIGAENPNSVRVALRLDNSTDPSLRSFFSPIIGFNSPEVAVDAIAGFGSRNIMLVLDRSGSMDNDGDDPEEPLTSTKEAALEFVRLIEEREIEGDRMGLIYYSDRGRVTRSLTDNFGRVENSIFPGLDAEGCTNIAHALRLGRNHLRNNASPRSVRVMVLLSDGVANTRRFGQPCQACMDPEQNTDPSVCFGNRGEEQAIEEAGLVNDDGILLYTISLGNLTNPDAMTQMAEATGGEHFFAPEPSDLEDVFEVISAMIPITLVE